MKLFYKIFVSLFFLVSIVTSAQKKFNAKGAAQVKVEDNRTKEETKEQVRQLAKINAIENVLGTYVEQETNIDLEEGELSFKILGNTRVKGEWLKTKNESFIEDLREVKSKKGKSTEIWITCKIEGVVREIVKPKLDFITNTLNCPQPECRTIKYLDGESFYLYFKSPSSGYLSVYIVEKDVVYRMLPYQEMTAPYIDAVPILADKSYIFFEESEMHNYFEGFDFRRIDQIEMETEMETEYLELYVVFSQEKFSKPILKEGMVIIDGSLPKSLSSRKFDLWIGQNRMHNIDFNYKILRLEISKR